jgi:predicted MPP superfamily phosphohydrolase
MKRTFPIFISTVLVALGLAFFYLGQSLTAGSPILLSILAVPFLAILIYPFVIWLLPRHHVSKARSLVQWAAFLGMAFISFLLPIVMVRDLIILIASAYWLTAPFVSLALVAIACGMLGIGLRRALVGPRLQFIDIPIAHLPLALDGLKIVQLSDLHVGPTIGRKYVEAVVALTLSTKPDLIALTGDIADGLVESLRSEIAPLVNLEPRGRIYYVTGNHEYYWRGQEWIEEFKNLGIIPLLNSNEVIELKGEKILIGGIVDPAVSILDPSQSPDVNAAAATAEKVGLKILLAHHPGIAAKAERAGFDLQLSGHTHGGQFFPWTLLVKAIHKFNLGLYQIGNLQIYVNPGTGSWGPPVRLGTHPEISVLNLKVRKIPDLSA